MTVAKWLTLLGGITLVLGLGMAFVASRYSQSVMGDADLGVAVWGDDPDSEIMRTKRRFRARSDFWFYAGLVLTALGVILQTLGGIL